jgi:hypothetical protein
VAELDELKIPKAMRRVAEEIIEITAAMDSGAVPREHG